MTMHFFGDSWTAGCELNGYISLEMKLSSGYNERFAHMLSHENKCAHLMKDLAYPAIIGKSLNESIVNHGITASSQDRMLYEFNNTDIKSGDDAIFALTSPFRKSCLTDENEIVDIQWDENDNYLNEYNSNWRSSQTCLLLYLICRQLGINAWFVNAFTAVDTRMQCNLWDMIPDRCWLIPKDENMVSWLFDEDVTQWAHEGNLFDWLNTENDAVKKYIRPCKAHPNLLGHQKIAECIAKEISHRKNPMNA